MNTSRIAPDIANSSTEIYLPHVGWLVYPKGDEVAEFLNQNWFEFQEQAFLWLYLRPGDRIVDCGAHAGLYSATCCKIIGTEGHVLAIEPNPETIPYLKANVALSCPDNVTIIESAASAHAGSMILHTGGAIRSAYSSVKFNVDADAGEDLEVHSITIDALLAEHQIQRVDFMKLDVEGAEEDVLAGMDTGIRSGNLPLVMVEFTELNLRGMGSSTRKLAAAWEAAGYLFFRFNGDTERLEPAVFDEPIWFENLFATKDVDMVNQRLRKADSTSKRIAREILRRGRAGDRLYRRGESERARAENEQLNAERERARAEEERAQADSERLNAENERLNAKRELVRAEHELTRAENERARAESVINILRIVNHERMISDARLRSLLNNPEYETLWKQGRLKRPVWFDEAVGNDTMNWVSEYLARESIPRQNETVDSASKQPDVSVILCTYKPRMDLLQWALQSIRHQSIPSDRFELIVVDNNSPEPLQAEQLDPDGVLNLKLLREDRQGLVYARVCGIGAARADLIVFVDDDNYLAPDYLANALRIAEEEPKVGAYSGIAYGRYEAPLPRWVKPLLGFVGVRNDGDRPITSWEQTWGKWDPIGAGMVVRRAAADEYAHFVENHSATSGLGRSAKSLMSGEDTLMARMANRAGFACSYQPSLWLHHCIKRERLTVPYFLRLMESYGRTYVRMERLMGRKVSPISGWKRYWFLWSHFAYRIGRRGWCGFVQWCWDLGYVREANKNEP